MYPKTPDYVHVVPSLRAGYTVTAPLMALTTGWEATTDIQY